MSYYHQMLSAAIVHPDQNVVLPFAPEPITSGKKNMNIIKLSAIQLASLIRNKQITAEETITQYLKQIELINPKINAVVEYKPKVALEIARQLDEKQKRGEPLGLLHGVPYTVKDLYNVKGYKTTAGSSALKDNIAQEDAEFVKRLNAAGAIFLGKTNTPEFGDSADTFNDVYGKTKNPYDLTRSAGGSSGGCGAALAAAAHIEKTLEGTLPYPNLCGVF